MLCGVRGEEVGDLVGQGVVQESEEEECEEGVREHGDKEDAGEAAEMGWEEWKALV